jgi:hypothetical protein
MVEKTINKMILTGVFLMAVSVTGLHGQVQPDGSLPFAAPFYQRPLFAQFLNSTHIIRGDTKGVSVVELETENIAEQALQGTAITAMMSNPHREGHVAVATEKGDVYFCTYSDGGLESIKLDPLAQTSLGVVKSILFHCRLPDKVLFACDRLIALCSYDNKSVTVDKIVSMEPFDNQIVFAYPDNISHDWFLISATKEARYRCHWNTGEILSLPEKILEHGCRLKKQGLSYYALGENQEHFNISFLTARPTFIIRHPGKQNTYLAASIGASPLKITLEKNSFYDIEYLAENRYLTFSIDMDRHNNDRLIFTTSSNVIFSDDGGKSWNTLNR